MLVGQEDVTFVRFIPFYFSHLVIAIMNYMYVTRSSVLDLLFT